MRAISRSRVVLSGSTDFDYRRRIWNAVVEQRPAAAIMRPTTAEEIAAVRPRCRGMRRIRQHELPDASQLTGSLGPSARGFVSKLTGSLNHHNPGPGLEAFRRRRRTLPGRRRPCLRLPHRPRRFQARRCAAHGRCRPDARRWDGLAEQAPHGLTMIPPQRRHGHCRRRAPHRESEENDRPVLGTAGGDGNFGVVDGIIEPQAHALGPSLGREVVSLRAPRHPRRPSSASARITADAHHELTMLDSATRLRYRRRRAQDRRNWRAPPPRCAPFGRLTAPSATSGDRPGLRFPSTYSAETTPARLPHRAAATRPRQDSLATSTRPSSAASLTRFLAEQRDQSLRGLPSASSAEQWRTSTEEYTTYLGQAAGY